MDHLLLQRDRILWELFIAIVGLSWVPPTPFCRHLAGQDVPVGKKCKKVWLVAALCLFWTIWLERNMVVFDNEVFFAHKMKTTFISNLWSWANLYSVNKTNSLLDFMTWMGCSVWVY